MIYEDADDNLNGYVLITCGEEKGKLQVNMTYQGDPMLISYLLESAQKNLEQDDRELVWKMTDFS